MQRTDTPKVKHPDYLLCSTTLYLYNEPVTVAPSGKIYEWESIDRLITDAKAQGRQALCPLTKAPITGYVKAFNIVAAVEDYVSTHPEAKSDVYEKQKTEMVPSMAVVVDYSQSLADVTVSPRPPAEITDDDRLAIEAAQADLNRRPQYAPNSQDNPMHHLQEAVRASGATESLFVVRERRLSESLLQRAPYLLNANDQEVRQDLVNDIHNLIWALHFEDSMQPPASSRANSYIRAFLPGFFGPPVPRQAWQDIVVATGPVFQVPMHAVLRAAIDALNLLQPELLHRERTQWKGVYDVVHTLLGGDKSLGNGGYANFAKAMGTIKNQPGYLIDQILIRVDFMLNDLCQKYPQQINHYRSRF